MRKIFFSAVIALITTGAAFGAECKKCKLLSAYYDQRLSTAFAKIEKTASLTDAEKAGLKKAAKKSYVERMKRLTENHKKGFHK
jgi:hypothetical protein